MLTRLRRRLRRIPSRPRRTVRLRLTLLYGALFVVSGALVLGITYALVDRATDDGSASILLPGGGSVSCAEAGDVPADRRLDDASSSGAIPPVGVPDLEQCQELAQRQHSDQMRELLVQSGVALAVMAVVSVVLGWLVAGRVLRPLRTITATTRDISATNLHARLSVDGPADELKELGDTIDDLLTRLERAFDAQRQFVANASHELRTPLARQRTLAQVALDDPDATIDSLRAAHERVLVAGAQQERLIEALLTLARGQTGVDQRDPLDLVVVADQIVSTRRAEAEQLGVDLHVKLAPAPAEGDVRLVERLVTNLIDNAIRRNRPNGEVRIHTGTRDARGVLAVTNTGPMVHPHEVEQLFQPFKRLGTDRISRGDGLGLGLSIVQAIADAHGATIDVRPQAPDGLHIEVTFPAVGASAATAPAPDSRATRPKHAGGRAPKQVGA